MNACRHQVGERLIHQPVPGHGSLAGEMPRDDHQLVMSAAIPGTGVSGVRVAVVIHLDRFGIERGETLANDVNNVAVAVRLGAQLGTALRKGLTVTFANTPSVT